jgi:hypothetical protein
MLRAVRRCRVGFKPIRSGRTVYAGIGDFHDFPVGPNWNYRLSGIGDLYLYRTKSFKVGDLVAFVISSMRFARDAFPIKNPPHC